MPPRMGLVVKFFLWCRTALEVKFARLPDLDILDLNMVRFSFEKEKER